MTLDEIAKQRCVCGHLPDDPNNDCERCWLIQEAKRLAARVKELEAAIEAALRIKSLWAPPEKLHECTDEGALAEYAVLDTMLENFQAALKETSNVRHETRNARSDQARGHHG